MSVGNQVFPAVDILIDAKLNRLQFDKTIQATIDSIVNPDTGEYRVKYTGNTFTAFAADVTKLYKINDVVYVVVPEGNFDNRKVITTKVSGSSLSYNQMTALKNQVIKVGPTFDGIYGYTTDPEDGVIAGVQGSKLEIASFGKDYGYNAGFQQYANNYELIKIKGSFLTLFQSTHSKGNYGLDVSFWTDKLTEDDKGYVTYRLDLNSFNGDPYRFNTYSPQEVVIKTQKNYLRGLKSITLFQEEFDPDKLYVDGIETEDVNTTDPNIFVKDIEIFFAQRRDLTDVLYYLDIATPNGNFIKENDEPISLVAELIYQGEDLTKTNKCTFKWFKRNLAITAGSTSYDREAGYGWEKLPAETERVLNVYKRPQTIEEYDVRQFVAYKQKYKVVVHYNSDVTATAEIEVLDPSTEYNFAITQETSGTDIDLLLTGNFDNETMSAEWFVTYPDGSWTKLTSGENQSRVPKVNLQLLYTSATFYCEVSKTKLVEGAKVKDYTLEVLDYSIVNENSESDVIVNYEGDAQYRYDANGDITIEDSERERLLTPSFAWKDGVATAYKLEFYAPGEASPLTAGGARWKSKYREGDTWIDKKSMLNELWLDTNNILHYTIKQKYKLDYNNNVITIKVVTIDGTEYVFKKEILFIKDGDQGTNGSTYSVAIRPCDADGNKISGFTALNYKDNAWQEQMKLKCYVYRDEEPIAADGYEWSWNENIIGPDNKTTQTILINGTGNPNASGSKSKEYYVKVKVTVGTNIIHALYPIDVVVGELINSKVDLATVPSFIKYTASGINPSYYNDTLEPTYDGAELNVKSTNESLITIADKKLKPITKFLFEPGSSNASTIGGVKCYRTGEENSIYIIHPIFMYLDTFGNEAINEWDGTSIAANGSDIILAPQMGAGYKQENKFYGVLMGKVKNGSSSKTGIFGYDAGVQSFSLTVDGKATFGRQGAGQIVIDGANAQIKSAGYRSGDNGAGMMIDLDEKKILSPTFSFDGDKQQFEFKVKSGNANSYFRILSTSSDRNGRIPIFYASSGDYYLQSANKEMKIDLDDGLITAKTLDIETDDGNLIINSDGQYLFNASSSFTVQKNGNPVFNVGASTNSYLQSADGGQKFKLDFGTGAVKIGNNFEVTSSGLMKINNQANFYNTGNSNTSKQLAGSIYANGINNGTSIEDTEKNAFRIEGENGASISITVGGGGHMYINGGEYLTIHADKFYLSSPDQGGIHAVFA